ncbi:MAG: hypothetical protein A2126_01100 [Candidatus Woykebacteria bacterium GWB1_45_5]|uniref:HD domain-containing protein n=1 Tax=Candidatus Woykebacteria bacterium GWB1_45_5 TaxID=1802592 RepID=A0A1G1W577_9BACT|nr:MAG: hypothetical protein A2126_01100 [Candidatus Woykebacteria bacterium GWB1_45_5]
MAVVKELAAKVKEQGGRALIIGGYARDEVMRRAGQTVESKDIDLEVYNLDPDKTATILEEFKDFAPPNLVGKSFGVIKLGPIDISFPRRESKIGSGHKGFEITVDPTLSVAEATRRRDLTINSIALDPLTNEIVDPHGGVEDLKNKFLRAVDPATFGEDPLRVLRLAQFAGRFGFSVEEKTKEIAKGLPLSELPAARIGEEWRKLLLKSEKPSVGLEVARDLGVLEKLHPELEALVGLEQEPSWHPEGDVWTHTLQTVDVAAEIVRRENLEGDDALVVLTATLLHDLGKPLTTEVRGVRGKQRLTSYGHAEAGVEPARRFLAKMEFGDGVNRQIYPLIRAHLYLTSAEELTDSGVRKLSARLKPATIEQLAWVVEADQRGRGGLARDLDRLMELTRMARVLDVAEKPVESIIRGRDLIALGLEPGRAFGEIIRGCQEAYLSGEIKTKEEAIEMAKKTVPKKKV